MAEKTQKELDAELKHKTAVVVDAVITQVCVYGLIVAVVWLCSMFLSTVVIPLAALGAASLWQRPGLLATVLLGAVVGAVALYDNAKTSRG